jgi:hypothetical protein
MASAVPRLLSAASASASALVNAARETASKANPSLSGIPRALVDAARSRRRNSLKEPLTDFFADAERQVDEVVRVLSPGPLLKKVREEETAEAAEAVRSAIGRWRDAQRTRR